MSKVVLLDAGPLGLVTNPRGGVDAVGCYRWMQALLQRGVQFVISEISDYEVRRELLRVGSDEGLTRLDLIAHIPGVVYAPL
ncbi:MAG TPA: hypothetical protein VFL82_04385, partial [Thermomicrobiales bacterium]|nr:hypothetical protein [Thermomicrobiales bacterium]